MNYTLSGPAHTAQCDTLADLRQRAIELPRDETNLLTCADLLQHLANSLEPSGSLAQILR